jgi:hypothetical protein
LKGTPRFGLDNTTISGHFRNYADALDIDSLWLDSKLGDGLIDVHYHNIPFGKPKDFFWMCPKPEYRRLVEILTIKPENTIDEQTYIIDKPMQGVIEEARRATIITCVYRDGTPRLWALKLPKDGEKDNEAWVSARSAAKTAMEKWVKLVWVKRAYMTRDAQEGYAPDPDWDKLPPFAELVKLGRARDHSRQEPLCRARFVWRPKEAVRRR